MTSANVTKRKMFIIATGIFMVTMSSVFFMMNENKLDINRDEVKAFVLQEETIETPQDETFYRELLDNDKDDILVLSTESNVEVASTEFHEVKDQNFFTLVHPDDLPEIGYAFMEAEESDSTIGPVRLKISTDEYKPYVISMESIENEAGEKISTALTLKDTSKAIGEKEKRVTERNDDRDDNNRDEKRETEEIKERVTERDDRKDNVDDDLDEKHETEEIKKRVTDHDERDERDDRIDHDDPDDRNDQRVVKVNTSDRDTNDREKSDRDSRPTKRKISDKKR